MNFCFPFLFFMKVVLCELFVVGAVCVDVLSVVMLVQSNALCIMLRHYYYYYNIMQVLQCQVAFMVDIEVVHANSLLGSWSNSQ